MKSKLKYYIVLGLGGYALLLVLLMLAERNTSSAIQSFWDALWYSVVTISTVGYGDLYPVTLPGRLIGVCFVLMSVGLLSCVVGAMVSRMGRLYPLVQLRWHRGKQWYVFSCGGADAEALAKDLQQREPKCAVLFPSEAAGQIALDGTVLFYPDSMAQAVRGKSDRCSLLFMGEDAIENYKGALAALPLGLPVFCCTDQVPTQCPKGLTLFAREESCAREYWRVHGLPREAREVLIVGDGDYSAAVLEQALLVNVPWADDGVRYHLYGDWSDFRRCHPALEREGALEKDTIVYHDTPWNADGALLHRADRIIFCNDTDEANLEDLRLLRRYYSTTGQVHLRLQEDIPGETVFGTRESLCTAELVLRSGLTKVGRMMHEIYRKGVPEADAWEALSDFRKQSNLAAADHLIGKARILLEDDTVTSLDKATCAAAYTRYCETCSYSAEAYRRLEHLRWMRFHILYNWEYAPQRDNAARKHPMLRPFEDLPANEREKDDYAWELLGLLAEEME